MAGLSPEQIADNWAACRRSIRTYKRVALGALGILSLGFAYVEGGRDALASCSPSPAAPVARPPH